MNSLYVLFYISLSYRKTVTVLGREGKIVFVRILLCMSLPFSEYLKLSLGRNEAFHVKMGQTAPLIRSGLVYQFLGPYELYLV